MNERSAKFFRQRRFMTVMPVICYPFVVLLFWSLGGGKGIKEQPAVRPQVGINKTIPQANNSRPMPGRLSLYQMADEDSVRIRELQRIEAKRLGLDTTGRSADFLQPPAAGEDPVYTSAAGSSVADINEQKVNRKLSELQRQLDEASRAGSAPPSPGLSMGRDSDSALNNIRLAMDQAGHGPEDPELATINQMLHTIRDIQNHGTEVEKIKKQSSLDRSHVFTISGAGEDSTVQSFGNGGTITADTVSVAGEGASMKVLYAVAKRAAFYDLDGGRTQEGQNTVGAIVYKSAAVVNEATLQLMLTDDIYLSSRMIPKGTFIFGSVKISNERVMVNIRTIQYDKSLYPVNLVCYGLDGQEGIPAPGAVTQDVTSQGMDNAMQLMNMSSMDPSVGAQAATAGIQTAKTLLSRKVRLVKANVYAGDAVLLVDANIGSAN